jgi:hypothetical protein
VTVFAALLMTVAAFALVGYPLLRPKRAEEDLLSTNHRGTEELLSQRDAAYAAIKELEFEYHLGNLSQKDYEDLRARYRQRAADILRQLDAAERAAAAARKKARAVEPSRDGGTAEEIERAVALLRQQQEGKAPRATVSSHRRGRTARTGQKGPLACPRCHSRVQPDDRFCGHCGGRLSSPSPKANPPRAKKADGQPRPPKKRTRLPDGQAQAEDKQ